MFGALDFRLFHFGGLGFFGGAFEIEGEQLFQNLFVRQIGALPW